MISIVLVTCNRAHLLKQCIDNVLSGLSDETKEVIVWDNASTDDTPKLLEAIKDPRVRVIRSEENIGTNAFARGFREATQPYLLELDDDIIEAPKHWDAQMRQAFDKIENFGFVAAHVIDDGHSTACDIIYRRDRHLYNDVEVNGVPILEGPTGGWCTITSRKIYDEVGGFRENPKFTFWQEDGAYAKAVLDAGYRIGLFEDIKVFHAAGPYYTGAEGVVHDEKTRYYRWRDRRRAWRNSVKRRLEQVSVIRRLNQKFGFYIPPVEQYVQQGATQGDAAED